MKEKGFSLIELIVITAILSILFAIAMPIYSKYKNSIYKTQIKSDVRNAIADIFLFKENYQNFPQLNPNPCTQDLTICILTDGTNNDNLHKTEGVILELNTITLCPNIKVEGFEIIGKHEKLKNYTFKFNSCTAKFEEIK